ncbi:phage tail tape measure protein [Rhodoferax fermentans]|uniref:phage tail tape measure protein n=1 Tax=Rhodoferax fermentans TaxID=28066 RepID=UPI001301F0E4|nr:phage tail tape measure protein [Rhodoferax fermentans]
MASAANKGLQAVTGAGAGAAGAFMVAKAALDKPMDYSLTLARMANTAFADRNKAGRIAGKAELNDAVMRAVRTGGGSRDDAAATLDSLISSGAMPIEAAKVLLPTLMRGSSASGATAGQLGAIAVKSSQNMNIPLADSAAMLDEANAAGKAGGFELRDMAKSLPEAMAAGRQSGLVGREGYRKIVAMMQASVITAGTKDEAANNVVNLLAKANSADTANDFKKQGIDLSKELVKGRANGMDSIDTFVSLVDRVASKDAQYTSLKDQLGKAKTNDEKRETLASMADILQGKAIGAVVQDRQALMSLVAVMNNRDYVTDIQTKMRGGKGSLGQDFEVIADESSYKATATGNEAREAASTAFNSTAGALNSVLDGATGLAREFPQVAAAAAGATVALGALAAASTAAALLGGGGGVGSKVGGWIGGAAGKIAALFGAARIGGGAVAGASTAGRVGAGFGALGKMLGPLGMILSFDAISDEDIARLKAYEAKKARNGSGVRGQGFDDPRRLDFLTLSAPGGAAEQLAAGQASKAAAVEGKLAIDVRVSDERVSATSAVVRQPGGVRVNPGNTNPGGFKP